MYLGSHKNDPNFIVYSTTEFLLHKLNDGMVYVVAFTEIIRKVAEKAAFFVAIIET